MNVPCYNLSLGGGLAVKASVDFSQTASSRVEPDLWSRTYVRNTTNTSSPLRERSTTLPASTPRPFSDAPKFSRPQSTQFSRPILNNSILSHIESASTIRPLIPARTGSRDRDVLREADSPSSPPDDILSDPNTSVLSKAYGSVLQPKDTLSVFTCIACSSPFPPDATIYPDPSDPSTTTRFLCKPCFTTNGGAKGNCAACTRPVLILSSDGGFIENAGRVWHRRCFRCDGCFKDVSDKPMVDLHGRPSCEECFDTCLKRPRTESVCSRRSFATPDNEEKRSNPGGMKRGSSRESSPAIEELRQRLGLKSADQSPLANRTTGNKNITSSTSIPDLKQRLADLSTKPTSSPSSKSSVNGDSPSRALNSLPRGRYEKFRLNSPKRPQIAATSIHSPSPRNGNNVAEEMEHRLRRNSSPISPTIRPFSPATTDSRDSVHGALSTPDLTDNSDCQTMISPPSTPVSSPPGKRNLFSESTPTKPEIPNSDVLPTKAVQIGRAHV